MNTSPTRSHGAVRALLALALGCGLMVTAAVAGQQTAGAASTTYSGSGTTSVPLPSQFASASGGPGWATAVSNTQVFNVFNNQSTLQVDCHQLSNASACWGGLKTVTWLGSNFATSIAPGLVLDPNTGHLYVYAVHKADFSAGVVCIDTTQPASATSDQRFCGYTQLSASGDAPLDTSGFAGLSAPVQIGNEWYSFNEVGGTGGGAGGGTQNHLLCFDVVLAAACTAGPVFPVPLGGHTLGALANATPLGSTGNDVIIQVPGSAGDFLTCFDASTHAPCWIATVTVTAIAGSPFPLLSASGTPTGFCLPTAGHPCWSSAGALVATPAGMTIGPNARFNGPAVTIGSSVYVANFTSGQVDCYDYATSSSCANFPKTLSGLSNLYTVNPDPVRPACLWVNSASGSSQIQNFDASTGGPCPTGPVAVQVANIVPAGTACTPQQYTSFQITQPARSNYTSATVQFESNTGAPLAGVPTESVDANGKINLSSLALTGSPPLSQFVITIQGDNSSATNLTVSLGWVGSYAKSCTTNGVVASGSKGYWLVASDGGIFSYGSTAGFYGSTGAITLNKPIVGMAATPDGKGYWLVASDGGIFGFGDAGFHGSTGAITLNKPIVGMAATPDGKGYWLVASDGGIFGFGDAGFHGSTGAITLNKPIVGMAATPDGKGYWLVASDGGIFGFGDAGFHGSTGAITLNKPIVGMAATPDGKGYWLVASDGGIFGFGDAGFHGSTGGTALNKPIVGMSTTPDGKGYWLVASDGGIFSYGDAKFFGSTGAITLNKPIVGMTS